MIKKEKNQIKELGRNDYFFNKRLVNPVKVLGNYLVIDEVMTTLALATLMLMMNVIQRKVPLAFERSHMQKHTM